MSAYYDDGRPRIHNGCEACDGRGYLDGERTITAMLCESKNIRYEDGRPLVPMRIDELRPEFVWVERAEVPAPHREGET